MTKRAAKLIASHAMAAGHFKPGTVGHGWVISLLEQYGREVREACALAAFTNVKYPKAANLLANRIREMPLP